MAMRWIAIGLGLLTVASLPAKDYKVGYIDSEEIISRYEAAREARAELETEIARFQEEADSLRREYEQARDEYETQELTLSEEGKRAKMAEVNQRKQRYDGYLDEVYRTGGRIDQKNNELIAPIVEKVNATVSELSKEEGFALVIDAAKSEIVYAEVGLDLTEIVVSELNREFEPTGPAGVKKVYYAVMPMFPENDESRQERVPARIRDFVYALTAGEPGAEMVSKTQVDQDLQELGKSTELELTQDDVLNVSRRLDADYAIHGKCSKQDRRIEFELSIYDVGLGNIVRTEEGTAPRDENLQEEVARVVRILLTSIARP